MLKNDDDYGDYDDDDDDEILEIIIMSTRGISIRSIHSLCLNMHFDGINIIARFLGAGLAQSGVCHSFRSFRSSPLRLHSVTFEQTHFHKKMSLNRWNARKKKKNEIPTYRLQIK